MVPENTLVAFELAIGKGFRAVECDVQLTKDGYLVVIHDETVERTTSGHGWVSHKTLTTLQAMTSDSGQIPTLSEVVNLVVVRHHKTLIIEIKADTEIHSDQVGRALARFLKSVPVKYHRYIEVHSFWYKALGDFRKLAPAGIKTAVIINGGFDDEEIIKTAQAVGANGVNVGYEFLSKRQVRSCHKAGLFIDCWAVSDKTVMRRLRPFGLDGIIENFTGRTLR